MINTDFFRIQTKIRKLFLSIKRAIGKDNKFKNKLLKIYKKQVLEQSRL